MSDQKRAVMEDLIQENKRLREALELAGKRCDEVHHPKSMQHKAGDPCPVEVLINKTLRFGAQDDERGMPPGIKNLPNIKGGPLDWQWEDAGK